jgi:phosphatidate cytidylyltransferase
MLRTRFIASLVLAAVGIPLVILGGIPYFVLIFVFLCIAAWEYARLFRAAGFQPAETLTVAGTAILVVTRVYLPEYAGAVLALLILGTMCWHLVAYEGGRDGAAADFAITLGGFVYLGWIGAYLIELRNLPDGMWWFWLILPSVWIADSAAYFVGKAWGKTPLSPRLSPKKTWEGYWGGVICGTLGGAGLALLWSRFGGLDIAWWQGGAAGMILSILTTLGDLGESMIKRQADVKDSSNIIPGHGGMFDRIDSWLWGAVLGYYLIVWFFL